MKIENLIISEIKKKGEISLDKFIEICLYGDQGYYIKKNPIGINNDFITAPEISQMFGEIIGIFFINYWKEKFKTEFNLIELGPGNGTLISDIIRTSSINKSFVKAAEITLIEKNINLINHQKKILNKINFKKANWNSDFKFKNNKPSIIYSNEFFDCFPVKHFYKKTDWYEKFIQYDLNNKMFKFVPKQVDDDNVLQYLQYFNNSKIAEVSKSRNDYFNMVCKFIRKNKGIFFTIDYGYNIPPKEFSLQAIYKHKKTHLFENLGKQDITAHVNFGELIDIAKKNKLNIDFYCTQKDFLMSLGIKERKEKLQKNKSKKNIENIQFDYERLVSDSQMGELFKVLLVSCF
tara:strand:- start:1683 stop:2726 length:1044 start_codon:yes stop_codon:yes gene_type:complete